VPAACSMSMAWDLGFQDADDGPSWSTTWTFMVSTMDLHGTDHGVSWCRPWIFMVPTMNFHGVEHGFSWCRPWIFMVSTMDFHGADHGFSCFRTSASRLMKMRALAAGSKSAFYLEFGSVKA
jgi:hypothetical protein